MVEVVEVGTPSVSIAVDDDNDDDDAGSDRYCDLCVSGSCHGEYDVIENANIVVLVPPLPMVITDSIINNNNVPRTPANALRWSCCRDSITIRRYGPWCKKSRHIVGIGNHKSQTIKTSERTDVQT